MRRFLSVIAVIQLPFAVRVMWRLLRTARGTRIQRSEGAMPAERVTVLVPVLDEEDRLRPCLEGLIAQPAEVSEILVIDGGSTDATRDLVAEYARRDRRVRLLDAAPIPAGVNGKAHGLQVGLERTDPASQWVLTIDADVRLAATLIRSLLAHAARAGDTVISVATRQRVSGPGEGLLHPALLTTLVYRFGIPGHATRDPAAVQANGQCCLLRRPALAAIGGFRAGLGSVCEDVTIARAIAATGRAVGFYEADALVWTVMYAGWREAWANWTRSLPMLDGRTSLAGWLGLVEVVVVQALPLPLLFLALSRTQPPRPPNPAGSAIDLRLSFVRTVNVVLVAVRLGVLVGTARAYQQPPWSYWLSPLADLPVAIKLVRSGRQRRHRWRGRIIHRDRRGDR
ncbi:MAG: glycosyltransferase family 2 protein [Chloroflexia bacterium]|nr:glycosyltransferase family 2 protein [Chloroflexia bacterium]